MSSLEAAPTADAPRSSVLAAAAPSAGCAPEPVGLARGARLGDRSPTGSPVNNGVQQSGWRVQGLGFTALGLSDQSQQALIVTLVKAGVNLFLPLLRRSAIGAVGSGV